MKWLSEMPPFQCENENPLVIMNARVDGDPEAPRKRNPGVSPEIEEIILHAMERDPKKRYQTAAAMKAELDDPASVQCDRTVRQAAVSKYRKTQMEEVALDRSWSGGPGCHLHPCNLADHSPGPCTLIQLKFFTRCSVWVFLIPT